MIDSRDKRTSLISLGLPFGRVLPNRDGLVTAEDFEQFLYLYRGIQAGGLPEIDHPLSIDFNLSSLAIISVGAGDFAQELMVVHFSLTDTKTDSINSLSAGAGAFSVLDSGGARFVLD